MDNIFHSRIPLPPTHYQTLYYTSSWVPSPDVTLTDPAELAAQRTRRFDREDGGAEQQEDKGENKQRE